MTASLPPDRGSARGRHVFALPVLGVAKAEHFQANIEIPIKHSWHAFSQVSTDGVTLGVS